MSGNDDEVELKNVKTTYELFEDGSTTALTGDNLTKYLAKVDNNVYSFTPAANDKQFRLKITLSEEYVTSTSGRKKTKPSTAAQATPTRSADFPKTCNICLSAL